MLHEKDSYIWNLNDSIKYFNKLDNRDKDFVCNGIKAFRADLNENLKIKDEFFKISMNHWSNERQKVVSQGPSAEWVLFSILEALSQMYISGNEQDVRLFFSNKLFE